MAGGARWARGIGWAGTRSRPGGQRGFGGVAWDAALAPLLRGEQGRVGALSAHAYPLDGCPGHARRAVQLHRLFSDTAAPRAGRRRRADGGHRAHRRRPRARHRDELGHLRGGPRYQRHLRPRPCGCPARALFAMARAGAAGVDIPLLAAGTLRPVRLRAGLRRDAAGAGAARVLRAAASARPRTAGSRLLPTAGGANSGVRVWATLTRTGGWHRRRGPLPRNAARVTVAPRGARARPATLRVLRAAPQRLARAPRQQRDRHESGQLRGRYRAITVRPCRRALAAPLPPASAGLLSEASHRRWRRATARNTL